VHDTTVTEVRTLVDGLVVGESPRWHDSRLWLANWGASEIIAVNSDGTTETMLKVPSRGVPISFDWLPDGRMLIVSGPEAKLLVQERDGSLSTYADLSHLVGGLNEIVADARGNVYVNGGDYKFAPGEPFVPGMVALVTPDGQIRHVAGDIHFPNGMVTTPDDKTLIVTESFKARLTAFDIAQDGSLSNRRVFAELGQGGDGMCLDAEGAIWTPAFKDGRPGVVRVVDGGEVLQRIELDQFCFACMLGGEDGRTLYILVAEWTGLERMGELFSSRTGQVLTARAPAPHAGQP
jgi:sugar lactone lactonase YvrE